MVDTFLAAEGLEITVCTNGRCLAKRELKHEGVQYKSLKVNRNGGKSKKSMTIFVVSPVEDLDSFYQKPFPE